LNHLGEAILSEEEARSRLQLYLKDLENPHVDYVSIKISTLYSQISMVGWDQSLRILDERLSELYRASGNTKFINLDMEEYRDLDLTIALFKQVLSKPEFKQTHAGIVLQSYLPDAYEKLKELIEWAKNRRGAPIKIRIVKGANLALEKFESAQRGWPLATFGAKCESDAQLKKMLEYAVQYGDVCHIGLGSHNLFDIAYALILRAQENAEATLHFEMLSGMAEPIRRVIHRVAGKLVLYSPEAKAENFDYAISYLMRRLDENGGPENFLRSFFHLGSNTEEWRRQVSFFKEACLRIDSLSTKPNRLEKRTPKALFTNEPDIDFSLQHNRDFANDIYARWQNREPPKIPCVISGKEMLGKWEVGIDPSSPHQPLYEYSLANIEQIREALVTAKKQPLIPFRERAKLLAKTAQLFREKKGDLLGALLADAGKTLNEGNGEVSEAIDFLEYYHKEGAVLFQDPHYKWEPKGTVLVAPPWNFSLSIPVGGIAAALSAGNSVIFKPPPETVLVGWELVKLFWEAGISKERLQFLCCNDDPEGSHLIQHPDLNLVILTGATSTAKAFLKMRPGLDLMAETGGKNAIIVTAMADRDLAIKDTIHSAFGHAGQKCSACSLLILEKELYHDDHFLKQLKEATSSLIVDSVWNKACSIPPLIRPPGEDLKRALTTLEEGEEWLLKPRPHPENPHLWSPGIKYHVKPGGYTHQTEFFGPLLGVLCAENLEEAIQIANGTPYGLTSGIHTLDDREKEVWLSKIEAGNLYINRTITGAIVRRQPFGGVKASSFGPHIKAGGPNYLIHLARVKEVSPPERRASLPKRIAPLISQMHLFVKEKERPLFLLSLESYSYLAKKFTFPEDPEQIPGEENLFYHVPRKKMTLRIEEANPVDVLRVVAACQICKTPLEISASKKWELPHVIVEEESTFLKRVKGRVRFLQPPSQAALKALLDYDASPVYAHGRFEMLKYMNEVSLSHQTHRYGYIY
ncbi:MAG: bifunctional proline dehydrogenase/L-glutamate gamma-semialdehyde dehydrogenase, partial [Chlamydiales bacterium]